MVNILHLFQIRKWRQEQEAHRNHWEYHQRIPGKKREEMQVVKWIQVTRTPGSNPIQKIRRKAKTPVNFLRTDPAIIPLENTIPQADPRTEVIISWTDVSELEIEEFYNKNLKQVPITLPEETHETAKERAFREEIIELFNIPKEDIPSTSSSQKLFEETTVLDLRDVLADVTKKKKQM